jgi:hypothetical protein
MISGNQMKKIYYERVGRKYIPVAEYDEGFMNSLREGTHLVVSVPCGQTYKYNIKPEFATLIAAGEQIRQELANAIFNASQAKITERSAVVPTDEQVAAWRALQAAYKSDMTSISYPSAIEIADAALALLYTEANKTISNPAVKRAWDHFQTVAALTKETHD